MPLLDTFNSILFMDASSNMIEQVEQKIRHLSSNTVKAVCNDLTRECPADLHADYIIMSQTLLHIKEVELILSRLYAVLNNGGHLLIIDFDKNYAVFSDEVHNGFEQEELIKTLKKIGFNHFQAKTFYYGEKLFMNKAASLFIIDSEKQLG